jgi:hypothetical protein
MHEHDASDGVTLDDGMYDAFVVWAEERDDGRLAYDLTITTGIHKGEVVSVSGPRVRDPIDLVGLPCALVVQDGAPRVDFR